MLDDVWRVACKSHNSSLPPPQVYYIHRGRFEGAEAPQDLELGDRSRDSS